MKLTVAILILALASVCWGQALPSAPKPVEHDPGAWAFTTGAATSMVGVFTKPSYGLAAGAGIAVLGNLQNSKNAHQNMIGGIGGAVAGYLIIKTLKNDWHHRK